MPHYNQERLVHTFAHLAYWTWNRLQSATENGFPFNEETITEQILLDLHIKHKKQIKIIHFNKSQEAKNGADWEWCFYTKNSYLPMLVQAKRIDNTRKNYANLDREIGQTGIRQIDKIIEVSKAERKNAIHVFYNFIDDKNLLSGLISNKCHFYQNSKQNWGCSFAFSEAVREVVDNNKSKSFDAISKVSAPWHELLCCNGSGNYDYLKNIQNNLNDFNAKSRKEPSKLVIKMDLHQVYPPTDSKPQYFDFFNENITDKEKAQLSAQYRHLNGIMLIDCSKIEEW